MKFGNGISVIQSHEGLYQEIWNDSDVTLRLLLPIFQFWWLNKAQIAGFFNSLLDHLLQNQIFSYLVSRNQ